MDVLAILIIKDGITLRNHAVVLEQDDGIRLIVALLSIGDQSPHVGTCFLWGGSFFAIVRF